MSATQPGAPRPDHGPADGAPEPPGNVDVDHAGDLPGGSEVPHQEAHLSGLTGRGANSLARLTARWRPARAGEVAPESVAPAVPHPGPLGRSNDQPDRHSPWEAGQSAPPRQSTSKDLPPWFRKAILTVILFVIGAWLVVRTFIALSGFWYTLFFAFFIGLCMEPAVNRLAARGMRRGMGTFLVMGGIAAFFIAFFAIFGGLLATQLEALVRALPNVLNSVIEWANNRFGTNLQSTDILNQIGLGVDDLAKAATNLGLGVLGILGQAVGLLFKLFTIALFSFYFAADGPSFRRTVASWLTPANQRTFLTVWDISTQKAGGYVISRGLMAVVSAFFHAVAFALLDVPYWLPMGLWVGMVSQFIPTIGTYLAGALPVILCLAEGSWVKALLVLGTVVLYQQVENYFVQPKITKSTMEIHASVAFGSVIVGSTLFGATGALLAIPVVATLQSVVTTYGRRYELVEELSDEIDGPDAARVAEAMQLANE